MSETASRGASVRLTRLTLTDFRNYAALSWTPGPRHVLVTGANGAGKTNLLEAISLLVPGRGLRGARAAELARSGASGWGVAARLFGPEGGFEIGTGALPDRTSDRRVFRLDGAPCPQSAVAAHLAATWLTPQMDRLFQEGPGGRRRFLDRLVQALEPHHAREIAAHDAAVAQRNRLLAWPAAEPAWLTALEETAARHAIAATAARLGLVRRLNATLAGPDVAWLGGFPGARLSLVCPIAERLGAEPALAAELWLRDGLARARASDRQAGATSLGAHRADLELMDRDSATPARLASTGEQKTMLVALILGHARLLERTRGAAPLLLLDEPTVHLDTARRDALLDALRRLPNQVFLTGVDASAFAGRIDAEVWTASGGSLRAPRAGVAPAAG